MFDDCKFKKECPFATLTQWGLICGLQYGKNRVEEMKECPMEKRDKKRKTKREMK